MENKEIILTEEQYEKVLEADNKPSNQKALDEFVEDVKPFYENKIIIDGIDVNRCGEYIDGYCNSSHAAYLTCGRNKDCYFKQLQRLKKENESNKALKVDREMTIENLSSKITIQLHEIMKLKQKNEELEQKNEELKQQNEELKKLLTEREQNEAK